MSQLLEMFTYRFILRAFMVRILISRCAALLGVPLVLKRYSMIGDGLSHVSFGALSIALAWLVNEFGAKLRSVLTLLFYAPVISGGAYMIWQIIFSGDAYGYLNGLLMDLGIIYYPIQWLTDVDYMWTAAVVVVLWMSFGAGFLSFIAGFKNIDTRLYEAAAVDGIRNRYQEFWYITLPELKPQLMFGAVMQISASFSVSTISQELCGFPSTKYSAHTILLHMQDYGSLRYEMGYACAIAVVLFVLMFVFKKGVSLLMRRIGDE